MNGHVYLIHFATPISLHHTTQHYLGWAEDWKARLAMHRAGRGARLTQVALERGIDFAVVQVWPGTRDFERYLKSRKEAPRLCPICGVHHRRGVLHITNEYRQVGLPFDEPWPTCPQLGPDWMEIAHYRQQGVLAAERAAQRGTLASVDTHDCDIPF